MKSLSITLVDFRIAVYFCGPNLLMDEQCCVLNVVMVLQLFGKTDLTYDNLLATQLTRL